MGNSVSQTHVIWYQVWVCCIGSHYILNFSFVIIIILIIYLFKISIVSVSHSAQNISYWLPAWLTDWSIEWMNEWMNFIIQEPDFSLRLFSSFLPILTLRNSEELITGSLSSSQFPSSLIPPNFPSCFHLPSLLPPEAPDSNCWEVSSNRIEIALNIRGLREDKQTWGSSVFGD